MPLWIWRPPHRHWKIKTAYFWFYLDQWEQSLEDKADGEATRNGILDLIAESNSKEKNWPELVNLLKVLPEVYTKLDLWDDLSSEKGR